MLLETIGSRGIPNALDFSTEELRSQTLRFVESMHLGGYEYRYSPSVSRPTLYSSAYACLTMSLFGCLDDLTAGQRREWADYFDAFQSPEDGLFRDPAIASNDFEAGDSWGARHLLLHLIPAYEALGHQPRHDFGFLRKVRDSDLLEPASIWTSDLLRSGDLDNRIMNVLCALQYQRDVWKDEAAGEMVDRLLERLWERRDPATGLWGRIELRDPRSISRSAQFGYHLYSSFLYDRWPIENADRILDIALLTQNSLGGYGVCTNSSACEDIDSIDLLCRMSLLSDHRREKVLVSLKRALIWILANQNEDGGFVFRRNQPMFYGHREMSSRRNESAMFPTWFRSLSIALIQSRLGREGYAFIDCPGLQFGLRR